MDNASTPRPTIDTFVARFLSEAPPLSVEQRTSIAALLALGGRP